MIQSALRVSYTSPKAMHWITDMLCWLSKDHCANLENLPDYVKEAENTAINAVTKQFLIPGKEAGKYEMGVSTPHIVFNYLDFLLWKQDTERKYNEFVFEFRNSVEHWYPQNPSEGMFDAWVDGKDRFGNLCIVSSKVNSKFSNLSPDSKKKSFTDIVSKGSIKLRIMAEKTVEEGEMIASYRWKETACKEHEEEMLRILKQACEGVEQSN